MVLSIQIASSPSSSPSSQSAARRWKYDVFLSFRGADTRWGFITNLYNQLHYWHAINTFKDDQDLDVGASISPALLSAIEESHLAIVVLSPKYASSPWCLDELAKIIESMETRENAILPIFFDVKPCDVRYQRGTFAEAFTKHEERFINEIDKVERWRTALRGVASLSGLDSNNYGCERELIKVIVKSVWTKVHPTITLLDSTHKLIGIDLGLGEMSLLLAHEVDDVRFIGIWGMGGVGKTTLARLVFERISHHFEVSQFLLNVSEFSAKHGTLVKMQKQLLSPNLKENIEKGWNEDEITYLIKKYFSNKKVLLVVDDVDNSSQFELLVGHKSMFGKGSRIIITTRDERQLIKHDIEFSLKMDGLNYNDSLQLFSQNAFKKDEPDKGYLDLSKCFVDYAKGIPLALKILGGSMYKRGRDEWISALHTLKKSPDPNIFSSLKLSYDGLSEMDKSIFLDVAFFYKGREKKQVIEMLDKSNDISSLLGITVLVEKSLLTIERNNNVEMHGLIQEMAWEIVRRESKEPGRRSRLCHRDDILKVFMTNSGTEAIKGIRLRLLEPEDADSSIWNNKDYFSKLVNLTNLEIQNLSISSAPSSLPDSLRSFKWTSYPSKSLPACYRPDLLVELKMENSKLVELWDGKQDLPNLRYMNLVGSKNLKKTPDFTGMLNLKFLNLRNCSSLVEIHPSIAVHKKIQWLDLQGCERIESFPSEFEMDSLEFYTHFNSSILNIPKFAVGQMKKLLVLYLGGRRTFKKVPRAIDQLVGMWGALFRKNSSLGLGLPSVCALHSLKKLSLRNADLCQGDIPDDIGYRLSSLISLSLDGNNFVSLPSSIQCLSKLGNLYLSNCQKLIELPALPSNTSLVVIADCCASLRSFCEPLQRANNLECFVLRAMNCFKFEDDIIFSMLIK